ncbi:MAG: peptidoglycan editing factor PgeF, partial [Peptococcaceae bacterium]|nr:peptidoglycan editing factor PgeF [Peptococcaceae bacterium]
MTGWYGLDDRWVWRDAGDIHWAEDSFLTDTGMVAQGFSSRTGGVSRLPYASLNVGYSSGDDPDAIRENRRRLSSAIGLPIERWACVRQMHGTGVKRTVIADAGTGIMDPIIRLTRADAQITDERGIALVTLHADCLPIYILDPKKPAIGLAHAGWRGTLKNMAGAIVEAMEQAFGSNPADLFASIGPGAGVCHYEVDEPVLSHVEMCFEAWPGVTETMLRPSSRGGRAYLDMYNANAFLLAQSGIPKQQISVSGLCTMCDNEKFFSYRKKDKGRQLAFFA